MANLPPGFVLESGPQAPALPPGFEIEPQGTMSRFGSGVARGLRSLGQGAMQTAERMIGEDASSPMGFIGAMNPLTAPAHALYQASVSEGDRSGLRERFNSYVQDDAERFAQGPGSTTAGKVGDVVGAFIGTGPLGIPGRAPTLLNAMGRAATMGGGAAGLQPVEGDYLEGKAQQVATGAAVGGGVGGALKFAGNVAERLLPQNATAMLLNAINSRANKTPFAEQGEQLAARTGVPLTPAAISGSKAGTMAENAARQSIFSRDTAFQADKNIAARLYDYVGGVMDRVRKSSTSPDEAGKIVQGTIQNGVRELAKVRDTQAAADYGLVRQMIGNGPSPIRPTALADRLQNIVEEFDGVPAADATKIAGWAKQQFGNLEGVANDLNKLLQTRRFLSKASAGGANLFEQVNPGVQRRIAAQLVSAIDEDLARAGDKLGGPLGEALKKANSNYAAHQKAIEAVEKSPLGRLLGDDVVDELGGLSHNTIPGERVMQRLKSLVPSEIGMVRTQLEKWNPDAWAVVKRHTLEEALSLAQQAAPSEGANVVAMRGNTFIREMLKGNPDGARLKAMFKPNEMDEINDAFEVIRRWGDKTGFNHSGTAGQTEVLGMMNTLKDFALKGSASAGGTILGTRAIARLMVDQGGRRALLQLRRLPPGALKAQQLTAYITAIAAGQQAGQQGVQDPQGAGPAQ